MMKPSSLGSVKSIHLSLKELALELEKFPVCKKQTVGGHKSRQTDVKRAFRYLLVVLISALHVLQISQSNGC